MAKDELGGASGVDRFALGVASTLGRGGGRRDGPRRAQAPIAPAKVVTSTSPKPSPDGQPTASHSGDFPRGVPRIRRAGAPSLTQTWHVRTSRVPAIDAAKEFAMRVDAELEGQRFEVLPCGTSTIRCSLTKTTLGMTLGHITPDAPGSPAVAPLCRFLAPSERKGQGASYRAGRRMRAIVTRL
jgi:hypothetical protein